MSEKPGYQELEVINLKLTVDYARLKGEYIGSLKGLLWWDLPKELKTKIEAQIKELESE